MGERVKLARLVARVMRMIATITAVDGRMEVRKGKIQLRTVDVGRGRVVSRKLARMRFALQVHSNIALYESCRNELENRRGVGPL